MNTAAQPVHTVASRAALRDAWHSERGAASAARHAGDAAGEWRHLERAHILSQPMAGLHVRTHAAMFAAAVRRRDGRETLGQLLRLLLAVPGTLSGRYPVGNTGGADVSAFVPMAVPEDLRRLLPVAGGAGMTSTHVHQHSFPTDPAGLPACRPSEVVELADGDSYELRITPVANQVGSDRVRMIAYNGSIPGPTLRVRQGSIWARFLAAVERNCAQNAQWRRSRPVRARSHGDGLARANRAGSRSSSVTRRA